MKVEVCGVWALCVLALVPAGEARAEEASLSARPTLYLGADDAEGGNFSPRLHLGLSGRSAEFGPGLRAEAEVSLLVSNETSNGLALVDNSSHLRLGWRPDSWRQGEGLFLTLLPLHSERLYLGWDYPLATPLTLAQSASTRTGADLRLQREGWYAFVSAKSAVLLNDKDHELYRKFTVIGGGGYDAVGALRLELQAAYAELGANPVTSVLGAPVEEAALAARVSYHHGLPIGPPPNWQRFRQDPGVWEKAMSPEVYPGGLAVTLLAEGLLVEQAGRANPDVFGRAVNVLTGGAGGEVRVRWDALRAFAWAQHRTLDFIQLATAGFPPFQAFSKDTKVGNETALWAAVDYHFERLHLTPGIGGGVVWPASYTTPSNMGGNNPPPAQQGERTVVIRDAALSPSVLPTDVTARAIWNARVTLRLDFETVSAVAEGGYTHDRNRYSFRDSPEGVAEPTADDPSVFGFHFLVQARF